MPNIIEVLQDVGLDKCRAQALPDCMTSISTTKAGISTVKFKTSNITATEVGTNTPKMACYIVWIPLDAYAKAQAAPLVPAPDKALFDAVGKLIKAKGRFHTEQNYLALVAAYDAVKEKA